SYYTPSTTINYTLSLHDALPIYQSFLNSIASPLQIIVRIREMDMDRYLSDFQSRLKEEPEAIYKEQVKNYTEFVKSLITTNKIRSEEHTSELQSLRHLVCRLLLE